MGRGKGGRKKTSHRAARMLFPHTTYLPHKDLGAPATPPTLYEPPLLPLDLNILPLGQRNSFAG